MEFLWTNAELVAMLTDRNRLRHGFEIMEGHLNYYYFFLSVHCSSVTKEVYLCVEDSFRASHLLVCFTAQLRGTVEL